MAPQRGSGFDQISMMIGELKGSVEEIGKYVHEGRHGINNLSQKFDALAVKIASDMAAVEARLDARLTALELSRNSITTARQIGVFLVQTVIAAAVAVVGLLTLGKHG